MPPSTAPIESVAPTTDRPPRRRRSVLAGLALVLACITIVAATMAIWVHQVALNTDRFTAVVTKVVDDPAFTGPIATKVSEQVITALDVQTRIADKLPGPSKALAPTLAAAAQGVIERQLEKALENPRVRQALLSSVSFAHERIVRFLRGDTSALTVVDGKVQLNVFPVVGAALTQLQAIGVIPADVTLPDLSADDAPDALGARLQAALGVTLPAGFGTVSLMEAKRLETAQTLVKAFDILVVLLVVLSVVLAVIALWLATNRRRMVVYLTIGVIISLLVARFATQSFSSMLVDGIADLGLRGSILVVLDAVVSAFVGLTTIIIVATAILLIVAYLAGRPAWLTRLTSGRPEATAEG
jgi:hypothetical protein